ncbi:MAG: hypothetical protein Crog4KO_36270 [Crocinitomicaceae bacterium]
MTLVLSGVENYFNIVLDLFKHKLQQKCYTAGTAGTYGVYAYILTNISYSGYLEAYFSIPSFSLVTNSRCSRVSGARLTANFSSIGGWLMIKLLINGLGHRYAKKYQESSNVAKELH